MNWKKSDEKNVDGFCGRCGLVGRDRACDGGTLLIALAGSVLIFLKASNIDRHVWNPKRMLARSPTHHGQQSVTESVALPPGPRRSIMFSTQPSPLFSVAEIGVLNCSGCGKPMKLARIEPDKPGFDLRSFECAKCNTGEAFLMAI
jgi:hypothetical protein